MTASGRSPAAGEAWRDHVAAGCTATNHQPAPELAAVRDAISEALDGARDCQEPGNLDRCKPCTAALDAVMDAVDTYAMAKQPAPVGTAWRLLDETRAKLDAVRALAEEHDGHPHARHPQPAGPFRDHPNHSSQQPQPKEPS